MALRTLDPLLFLLTDGLANAEPNAPLHRLDPCPDRHRHAGCRMFYVGSGGLHRRQYHLGGTVRPWRSCWHHQCKPDHQIYA